ncbi:MAG: alginate export family protein [Bacteroidales bacterium]|nr:alginate export family protein [Bacteroidales bacterium]
MISWRRNYKIGFLIIGFLFYSKFSNSQFVLSGEFRPRFEFRDGYKQLMNEDENPALITTQRSRLNFGYKNQKFSTKLSLQDVRIWGETSAKEDVPGVHVIEAWAELLFNRYLTLKLGRQVLKYDDQRLLAATNWNNVSSSHDVALLKFSQNNLHAHLGLAYNNDKENLVESYYPVNYYKTLSYLWLSKDINENFKISFIDIVDGNQKDTSDNVIYFRNTLGPNIMYNFTDIRLKIKGNFYIQKGKDKTGTSLNAYFYSANIEKYISDKLNGTIGIDYYSGNNGLDTNRTVNRAFNKLYGSGHSFCGYMDYFTSVDVNTKGGGLMDIYLSAKYSISEKLIFQPYLHFFNLANNVAVINQDGKPEAIDKYLGAEIDFKIKYIYSDVTQIDFGYSFMMATKSMETIKGGNMNEFPQFAWIMITLKPEFIRKE